MFRPVDSKLFVRKQMSSGFRSARKDSKCQLQIAFQLHIFFVATRRVGYGLPEFGCWFMWRIILLRWSIGELAGCLVGNEETYLLEV